MGLCAGDFTRLPAKEHYHPRGVYSRERGQKPAERNFTTAADENHTRKAA
uniref:Uncharacterized protein n=1 Tax=Ackermannviridae sp. TaxID=2831612 RepID=A0A8S5RU15_9CAUD|nr:MAG TPA: hypothetical protein [Ackermannviridae sp.]